MVDSGKLKLIVCGFHEATLAAFAIARRLTPDAPQHLGAIFAAQWADGGHVAALLQPAANAPKPDLADAAAGTYHGDVISDAQGASQDDVDITGEPTAFGCPGDFPAKTEDSEMVRRLRDAGAVIVGKTNTVPMIPNKSWLG